MRKRALILLAAVICSLLTGCGASSKKVHCDRCGREFDIPASSNMEESWIIYCEDCQIELGLNDIVK